MHNITHKYYELKTVLTNQAVNQSCMTIGARRCIYVRYSNVHSHADKLAEMMNWPIVSKKGDQPSLI